MMLLRTVQANYVRCSSYKATTAVVVLVTCAKVGAFPWPCPLSYGKQLEPLEPHKHIFSLYNTLDGVIVS